MVSAHVGHKSLPSENIGKKSCSIFHRNIALLIHLYVTLDQTEVEGDMSPS